MPDKKNILYIANVQGPEIVKSRGIVRNYSIAGNTKVFAISRALKSSGHSITIYSQGTVAERTGQFHKYNMGYLETFDNTIPIIYGSTIDNRLLRNLIEWISALRHLPIIFRHHTINTVFLYNISFLTLVIGVMARCFGKKVYLEYEDSAVVSRVSPALKWKRIYRIHERILCVVLSGAFAPSLDLLENLGVSNCLCLPGALGTDIFEVSRQANRAQYSPCRPLRLIYAGGLDSSKGIERFLMAIEQVDLPLDIHICGKGPLAESIAELCRISRHTATFHGLVTRKTLIQLMVQADVGINTHRSDLHKGGSWPFKVVEYLAACGTVFCNTSSAIPLEIQKHLFLYHADDLAGIIDAFTTFLKSWPTLQKTAFQRRAWALERYGPNGIATQLEKLMAGKCNSKKIQ